MPSSNLKPLPLAVRHATAIQTAQTIRAQGWVPQRSVNDSRVNGAAVDATIQRRMFYTAIPNNTPHAQAINEPWVRPISTKLPPLTLKPAAVAPALSARISSAANDNPLYRALQAQIAQRDARIDRMTKQLQQLSRARVVGEGKSGFKLTRPAPDGAAATRRVILPRVRPVNITDLTKLRTYVNPLLPISTKPKPAANAPAKTKPSPSDRPQATKTPIKSVKVPANTPIRATPAKAPVVATTPAAPKAAPPAGTPIVKTTPPKPLPLPPPKKATPIASTKPKPLPAVKEPKPTPVASTIPKQPATTTPKTNITIKPSTPPKGSPPKAPSMPKPPRPRTPQDTRTPEEIANDLLMADILAAIARDHLANGEDPNVVTIGEILTEATEREKTGVITIGELALVAQNAADAAANYTGTEQLQADMQDLLSAAVDAGVLTADEAAQMITDAFGDGFETSSKDQQVADMLDAANSQAAEMYAAGELTLADYNQTLSDINDAVLGYNFSDNPDTDIADAAAAMNSALGNFTDPVVQVEDPNDSIDPDFDPGATMIASIGDSEVTGENTGDGGDYEGGDFTGDGDYTTADELDNEEGG